VELGETMSRLLLIHTGGTISMIPGPDGFMPARGVAEGLARSIMVRDLPGSNLEIVSVAPLIDSAAITPAYWNQLIKLIAKSHGTHDGFVVTHGTDTLAFTAAALTFALDGLKRPVVLTGAMRPAASEGSDALDNLRSALTLASRNQPGVWVQFAGRTMIGDRVVKASSIELDAFREIPLPVAKAEHSPAKPFAARNYANHCIAVLTLSPGLTAEAFDSALALLDGAVLRCYGSGTIPNDRRFQNVLRTRIEKGQKILAISQCEHGGVRPGEYAASAALRELGVIDGGALTTEAAVAKLTLMLSEQSQSDQCSTHEGGHNGA